jgi:methyl-accepting chemotaxis protein
MEEVVTSVKRVTDIIGEIAAASLEQSAGINQVNDAVIKMDDVTQQNTALVEEAAAAAESMMEQAEEMMQAMSVFVIEGELNTIRTTQAKRLTPVERNHGRAEPVVSFPKPVVAKAVTGSDDWEEF